MCFKSTAVQNPSELMLRYRKTNQADSYIFMILNNRIRVIVPTLNSCTTCSPSSRARGFTRARFTGPVHSLITIGLCSCLVYSNSLMPNRFEALLCLVGIIRLIYQRYTSFLNLSNYKRAIHFVQMHRNREVIIVTQYYRRRVFFIKKRLSFC
jgi:hypothetical protein